MAEGVFEFRARGCRRVPHPETCGVSLSSGDSMRFFDSGRKFSEGTMCEDKERPYDTWVATSRPEQIRMLGCPDVCPSECRAAGSTGPRLFEREGQPVAHLERRMLSLASEVGYCGRSNTVPSSVTSARPTENLTSTRNRRRLLPSVPSNRAVIGASSCS